jgi:hypothetical protein
MHSLGVLPLLLCLSIGITWRLGHVSQPDVHFVFFSILVLSFT